MDFFSTFSGKSVLITGGLGFIGSNLAHRLLDLGAKVTIVDSLIPNYGGNLFNVNDISKYVNVNISDVRDKHSMRYLIQGKDYLFNLAGQTSHMDSMKNPFTDLEINTHSQLSILESCREWNPDIKIVFASTRQLYGKPEYLPVDEKHLTRPVDVNGINKMAGENYHILYNNVYGIRSCALRLTNTFGPRMRVKDARQTFLGIWIKLLCEDMPFEVWRGNQLRDFNYVEDAVEAFMMAAASENSNGKIYNLGDKKVISLKDMAQLMVDVYQKGSFDIIEFPEDRKSIDIGDYYSDFSMIKKELGWSPKVSLTEALEKTFHYYDMYLDQYVD